MNVVSAGRFTSATDELLAGVLCVVLCIVQHHMLATVCAGVLYKCTNCVF